MPECEAFRPLKLRATEVDLQDCGIPVRPRTVMSSIREVCVGVVARVLLSSLFVVGCKKVDRPETQQPHPGPDSVGNEVVSTPTSVADPAPEQPADTVAVVEPAPQTPPETEEPAQPAVETPPEPAQPVEESVDPRLAHCPDFGEEAFVYSIGSSTLASLLGPLIEQTVKHRWPNVRTRKWGKASSGMARPDFHDWVKEMPAVNDEYDPDVYIVNLGTNDFQSVLLPGGGWAKAHTPEWDKAYGDRVDALLKVLSGERKRLIVWVGPSAFPARNARQIGPKVNRVIKQRIKAFDGNAFYVDAFTKTSPERGKYIETVTLNGKQVKAYGPDGIHLSNAGVKVFMSRPLFKIVGPCLDARKDDKQS